MKYRGQDGGGDLFAFLEHQRLTGERQTGISRLNEVIEWEDFRQELEDILGYRKRDSRKGGRPPFDPVFMFKVLVLQKLHNLSDEGTEFQIRDRFSFMHFLGLRPGDAVPDQNTIWVFREALEKDQRDGSRRLFNRFHQKLVEEGMIAREGSIVDASFVEAPRQRNTREENQQIKEGRRPEGFQEDTARGRQKDCDARWTRKRNQSYYGYKNHIKVDARTKLVDAFETTAASVHDSQILPLLVNGEDRAVIADSAYMSRENEQHILRRCDCEEYIVERNTHFQRLTEEQHERNRLLSRIRARVEHVFGRLTQLGLHRIRSIGLDRARQHNALSNLVYNLDRYALLAR